MSTPFKLKGWSGYQNSPLEQKEKEGVESFKKEIHGKGGTRGTGKTYEERWGEMTTKEKKEFGSLKHFIARSEHYHFKKDVEAHFKEKGYTL